MHIIGSIILIVAAMDIVFGAIRIKKALKRRRGTDTTGQLSIEPLPAYFARLWRAAAPALIVLVLLITGVWALFHFGLRPIHEWRS